MGKRILVVGVDGGVGSALAARLRAQGMQVTGTSRRRPVADTAGACIPLDLASDLSGWTPPGTIDIAYLCAAMTGLAGCRDDPQTADRINRHNTLLLARRLADAGAFVVFLSTSLVLDGLAPRAAADAPRKPACDYGRQKALAEDGIAALGASAATLRLTKVIRSGMPVLGNWPADLAAGRTIHPFDDLRMAPIRVDHAVEALVAVGHGSEGGLFQVSATHDITYADAAFHIAERLGVPRDRVSPCRSDEAGVILIANPRHTSLDATRLEQTYGIAAPSPFDALDALAPP
ncbi:dTDP-4-dehydrorhamnose reductase [Azospirillum brasilense]|uniref:dTDP-4-dehydrorhamnose reductase n=1 Tax=Azospirillum brasilense TaxID=192 RepID=A0A560BWS2_AZOBR|nr:sugar nucleotide-binding protein [Azospirillum brasilense]MBK3732707.1 sugar nucleotide-binding protein [Azospirillum brasilense]TWA77064.1 dTDP-4-dehydrorhamnose reductase [Azospirillum brasilense]